MREIRCQIEFRQDEIRQSPGRVVGTLLTYAERALDRPERFAEGALTWDESGIILNEAHARTQPIMCFEPQVSGREVRIDAALPDTQRGRDAATMVRNKTLRGLSIEFVAADEAFVGGVREVRRARLLAAALVDDGSYRTSVEVRQRGSRRRPRVWL